VKSRSRHIRPAERKRLPQARITQHRIVPAMCKPCFVQCDGGQVTFTDRALDSASGSLEHGRGALAPTCGDESVRHDGRALHDAHVLATVLESALRRRARGHCKLEVAAVKSNHCSEELERTRAVAMAPRHQRLDPSHRCFGRVEQLRPALAQPAHDSIVDRDLRQPVLGRDRICAIETLEALAVSSIEVVRIGFDAPVEAGHHSSDLGLSQQAACRTDCDLRNSTVHRKMRVVQEDRSHRDSQVRFARLRDQRSHPLDPAGQHRMLRRAIHGTHHQCPEDPQLVFHCGKCNCRLRKLGGLLEPGIHCLEVVVRVVQGLEHCGRGEQLPGPMVLCRKRAIGSLEDRTRRDRIDNDP
jgi:hypothetical protein